MTKTEAFQGIVNSPDMQNGRIYQPFGGNREDIVSHCGSCGGPFAGVCEEVCRWCGTMRKVFMYDVSERPERWFSGFSGKGESEFEMPTFGLGEVNIGKDSLKKVALGTLVTIGQGSRVDMVGSTGVKTEGSVKVEEVVCDYLDTLDSFRADIIVARSVRLGVGSNVTTMYLLPGGVAEIYSKSIIWYLYIGPGAKVTFKDKCWVREIKYVGSQDISVGDGFKIDPDGTEQQMGSHQYTENLTQFVKNFLSRLSPSIKY
ncbi:hypothetical protein HY333_01710 [Candidatus Collierbacteria bacterium]|nr:hypothetical protein [Candidatus Collierbacteria bacterium]